MVHLLVGINRQRQHSPQVHHLLIGRSGMLLKFSKAMTMCVMCVGLPSFFVKLSLMGILKALGS